MTLVAASAAGRIGTPREVAAVVRLLSGDAAASVTGRIIRIQSNGVVDSLMTELGPPQDALLAETIARLIACLVQVRRGA